MSDRDIYVEKAKAQLEQWNAEIDKLQAKAREANADAQKTYEDQIAEMKKNRDQMEEKLREMRSATEESWKDMQSGFEAAWKSMQDSVEKAMSRFR